MDDGGTANGGVDTSPSQSFTITVTGVNDAPSFTKGANQSVLEDAGEAEIFFLPIKPGSYPFYCKGLQNKGMEGRFVVK